MPAPPTTRPEAGGGRRSGRGRWRRAAPPPGCAGTAHGIIGGQIRARRRRNGQVSPTRHSIPGTTSCIVRVATGPWAATTGVRCAARAVLVRDDSEVCSACDWLGLACWASDSCFGVRRHHGGGVDGGPSDDGGRSLAAPPATARLRRRAVRPPLRPTARCPIAPTSSAWSTPSWAQNSGQHLPGASVPFGMVQSPRPPGQGGYDYSPTHLRVQPDSPVGVGCGRGRRAARSAHHRRARQRRCQRPTKVRASATGRAGHARLYRVALSTYGITAELTATAAAAGSALPSTVDQAGERPVNSGKANQNVFDSEIHVVGDRRSRARPRRRLLRRQGRSHRLLHRQLRSPFGLRHWRGGGPHRRQPRRQRHGATAPTSPSIPPRPRRRAQGRPVLHQLEGARRT